MREKAQVKIACGRISDHQFSAGLKVPPQHSTRKGQIPT